MKREFIYGMLITYGKRWGAFVEVLPQCLKGVPKQIKNPHTKVPNVQIIVFGCQKSGCTYRQENMRKFRV